METLTEGSMKFVIDGRTYDVATSTAAAVHRGSADRYQRDLPPDMESVRYEHVLYRTQRGAFFVHVHETMKGRGGKPVVEDRAEAYTPEMAVQWIQMNSAMVLDPTGLPLPDEA